MTYINFTFHELEYSDTFFAGVFEARDYDVFCRFRHDRQSNQTEIRDNNKPIEEILPLPVGWLEYQLERNGKLERDESKVSF